MRCYPEYKESGVEWIGEIPKNWEVKRLKYNRGFKHGSVTTFGIGTTVISLERLFFKVMPSLDCIIRHRKSIVQSAKKHASPDDILVSVRAPVGAINVADQEYGIGRGLCAIHPRTLINLNATMLNIWIEE